MDFNIKQSLKNHYLFEYPIIELINTFRLVFEKEQTELMRVFVKRLESIYEEPKFSQTIFNISDIIVYKYFNDDISFLDKAFVTSKENSKYPFYKKIIQLKNRNNE